MKKFNKIVPVNILNLPKFAEEEIGKYSEASIKYLTNELSDEKEIIELARDAQAILGSWNCHINDQILDSCPNIKYIGICGTSLANIDLEAVRKRNIVIKNVIDYGDEATAEFIFSQLLNLCRGLGQYQWRDLPAELNNKKIGIIGLGAVGKQIARLAQGFNMQVSYFSRTRNKEWESKGLMFQNLDSLLSNSEIISLSVPRNLKVIDQKEFDLMKSGTIFVNTSIGPVFDLPSFKNWIENAGNYAIFDNQEYLEEVKDLPRVIALSITAGKTKESIDRLGHKVIDNIKTYLGE